MLPTQATHETPPFAFHVIRGANRDYLLSLADSDESGQNVFVREAHISNNGASALNGLNNLARCIAR